MQWAEPGPSAPPKRKAFQSKTPCVNGRTQHRYDPNTQICVHCKHKRPYDINAIRGGAQKAERAPKRVGGSISRTRIYESIAMLLDGTQKVAKAFAPQIEPDMLSPQEIAMLADALADEANSSERVKKFIVEAQKNSVHAKLVITLIVIAAPRLVRHAVLPDGSEQLAAAAMAMAAGGAPDGDRGDELGEEHAGGGGPAAAEAVPGGDEDQDGPQSPANQVPSRNGHQDSSNPREHAVRATGAEAEV